MWSGQWPGPEPAGLGRASTMTIVLRAGPGHTFCGPGTGLIIQFAGRARACTTSAGPGRAWASNHICGPGLGLNFRPVQGLKSYLRAGPGPKFQARAGPYPASLPLSSSSPPLMATHCGGVTPRQDPCTRYVAINRNLFLFIFYIKIFNWPQKYPHDATNIHLAKVTSVHLVPQMFTYNHKC